MNNDTATRSSTGLDKGGDSNSTLLIGALLLGLSVATFLLHDVHYVLNHPYWLDEAWVAVLSKLSLAELPDRAASAPVGWLIAMRLIPGSSEQRFRLISLASSVGSVVVATLLAYQLTWGRRWKALVAGALTGGAVALSPIALRRNDLKQFTTDAFIALVIFLLVERLDQHWTRRRFVTLTSVAIVGAFFSYVSMFVGAAMLTSLLAIAIRKRHRIQIRQILVGGFITTLAYTGIALLLVLPGTNSRLYAYWESRYLRLEDGLAALAKGGWERLDAAMHAMGLGGAFAGSALILLGLVALAQLGRLRVALGYALLVTAMVGLAVAHRYPFLDVRTSHFLLITSAMVAGIGIARVILESRLPRSVVVASLCLVAGGLVMTALPHVRSRSIPSEDVRSQTRYVEDSLLPDDVVMVNLVGSFGASYYWQSDASFFVDNDNVSTGWITQIDRDNLLVADDRSESAISATLDSALSRVEGTHGRIWIIRTHLSSSEAEFWNTAFASHGLTPVTLPVGVEPLAVIEGPNN